MKVSDLQAQLNGHIEQTRNNISTLENRATTLKPAIDTVKADLSKLPTHKDFDLLKKQTTNAQEFNQFMQAYVIELARLHGAIKLLQLSVQRLVAANQPAEISSALVCKLSDDVLEIGRRINRLEGLGLSKSFSSEVSDSEIPNEAPDNETFYMLISTELSN